MKRLLFAGGVVLALAASPAHAQAVVTCTNCSTIGQQLIDYGKQIQQLANEIQTATNTLNPTSRIGAIFCFRPVEHQRIGLKSLHYGRVGGASRRW